MIDLDAFEDNVDETELYCQFGAALCMNKLAYHQFQSLRGKLLADRYINPGDRTIFKELVLYLTEYQAVPANVSWLFSLYLNISHIFAHYTELEQIRILEILEEEKSDCSMETML